MNRFIKFYSFIIAFALIATSFSMFSVKDHIHAASATKPTQDVVYSLVENGEFNTDDFKYYKASNMTSTDASANVLTELTTSVSSATSYHGSLTLSGKGVDANTPLIYKDNNGDLGIQVAGGTRTVILFEAPYTGSYLLDTDFFLYDATATVPNTNLQLHHRISVPIIIDGETTALHSPYVNYADGRTPETLRSKLVTLEKGDKLIINFRSYDNVTFKLNKFAVTYKAEKTVFSVLENSGFNTTDFKYYKASNMTSTDISDATLTEIETAVTGATSFHGNLTGLTGYGVDANTPLLFKTASGEFGVQAQEFSRTVIIFEAPYTGTYLIDTDFFLYDATAAVPDTNYQLHQRFSVPILVAGENTVLHSPYVSYSDGKVIDSLLSKQVELEAGDKLVINFRTYSNVTFKLNKLSVTYRTDKDAYSVIENGEFNNIDFKYFKASSMTSTDISDNVLTQLDTAVSGASSYHGNLTLSGKGVDANTPLLYKTSNGELGVQTAEFTRTLIMFEVPFSGTYQLNTDFFLYDASSPVPGTDYVLHNRLSVPIIIAGETTAIHSPYPSSDGRTLESLRSTEIELEAGDKLIIHFRSYSNVTIRLNDLSLVLTKKAGEGDCDHASCTKTYSDVTMLDHVATWSCGVIDTEDVGHDYSNGSCPCGSTGEFDETVVSVIEKGQFNFEDFKYYKAGNLTSTDQSAGILTEITTAATATASNRGGLTSLTGKGTDTGLPLLYKASNGTLGIQIAGGTRTVIVFEAPANGTYVLHTDLHLYEATAAVPGTNYQLHHRFSVPTFINDEDTEIHNPYSNTDGTTPDSLLSKAFSLEKGDKIYLNFRSYDNITIKINELYFEVYADEEPCDHSDCTKSYSDVTKDGHVATWSCGEVDVTDTDHDFTNGNCACGATCNHNYVNGECDECGETCPHTGEELKYTVNGDKHTASYDCCGLVVEYNVDHDFTNGDCICGATKPTVAPDTGDTTLSVSVAIAVITLIGFALISKKKR